MPSIFWPVIDWNLGIFLWRTMGSLLLILVTLTIIPGPLHTISGQILRWPILFFTYAQISAEFLAYCILRVFIRLVETVFASPRHRFLRTHMANAPNYATWLKYAKELDESQGRDLWQQSVEQETGLAKYNWAFVRELLSDLRASRAALDLPGTLHVLQQCTRKNVGGVMSPALFSFTNSGEPKHLVTEFLTEVVEALRWITTCASEQQPVTADDASGPAASTISRIAAGRLSGPGEVREKVSVFLRRARAAYGRTALVLSGGASLGTYHFGVVQALYRQRMLPHIISGTSAGAVIGAFVGVRTDEEIERDLTVDALQRNLKSLGAPWVKKLACLWKNGTLYENQDWLDVVSWFTMGDMTFEEAFRKTGRTLCITLSATTKSAPPVLLNYVTAPHVVIASAVICSSAVPGFISPMRLQIKDSAGVVHTQGLNKDQLYFDGSIEQDIPTNGLAEMFNCQFFLACQCNPHIVPFFYNNRGDVGRPSRWSLGSREQSWRGGFLLSALEMFLKTDMRAKLRFLGELEAPVGFTGSLLTQRFSGTVTMVPQVTLEDYFKIVSDPSASDMRRYLQGGAVAAYEKMALLKLHCSLANTINECLSRLVSGEEASSTGASFPPAESPSVRRSTRLRRKGSGKPSAMSGNAFSFAGVDEYGQFSVHS